MAEGTVNDTGVGGGGLSRRSFLKAMGLGLGATFMPKFVAEGIEGLAAHVDQVAKAALEREVRKGTYTIESGRKITSFDQLRDFIDRQSESLTTLTKHHVLLSHRGDTQEVAPEGQSPIYIPASTIKIPLCYEAYLLGQKLGKSYLNPDFAKRILDYSDDLVELLMSTPYADNRRPEQLEEIVREMLTHAHIPPANKLGELPLKVNIHDQYSYLMKMDLPDIMKQPMLQEASDDQKNYGVSTVILQNSRQTVPAYFKIGLLEDSALDEPELVNAYYLQMGGMKVLGYAQGPDRYETHKQMLITCAASAHYISQ